jgi:hypothetical protein
VYAWLLRQIINLFKFSFHALGISRIYKSIAHEKSLFTSPAGIKKFEYCVPTKTPTDDVEDPNVTSKDLNSEMVELRGFNKTEDKPSSMSPFMENKIFFATCSPRKNRNMKKRHYNVSPDGVSSLDEYTTTTITYETNSPTGGGRTRRMSITISDGNSSSEMSSEPVVIAESSHETSSLITQSTNCSRTTGSPLPSPSSGLSFATACKTLSHNIFYAV